MSETFIACDSNTGHVRVYEYATGYILRETVLTDETPCSAAFSLDNVHVAIATYSGTFILDADSLNIHTLLDTKHTVHGVYSPDGMYLATAGSALHLITCQSTSPSSTSSSSLSALTAPTHCPQVPLSTGDSSDYTVASKLDPDVSMGLVSVCFSPSSRQIVTGARNRTAVVWSVPSLAQLRLFERHRSRVTCALFVSDAIVVSSDLHHGTINVWDSGLCLLNQSIKERGDVIWLAVSPDGAKIVSAGSGNTAILYNTSDYAILNTITLSDRPERICFYTDDILLAGVHAANLQAIDVSTGLVVQSFAFHENPWCIAAPNSPCEIILAIFQALSHAHLFSSTEADAAECDCLRSRVDFDFHVDCKF